MVTFEWIARGLRLAIAFGILISAIGLPTPAMAATRGEQSNGHSNNPAISADGRYVAFSSNASNLVDGDTNGKWDVYVRERNTGHTKRVSVSSHLDEANCGMDVGSNEVIALSSDGRFVAFRSCASNLIEDDTNANDDIFVHDTLDQATERVSVDSQGEEISGAFGDIAMSGDGRYILFASDDPDVVPGDTNGTYDVFMRDRSDSTTTLVSAGVGGQGNGPVMSMG